jgi:hypothetical protein
MTAGKSSTALLCSSPVDVPEFDAFCFLAALAASSSAILASTSLDLSHFPCSRTLSMEKLMS